MDLLLHRRQRQIMSLLFAAAAVLPNWLIASSQAQSTERVSVSSAGGQSNFGSASRTGVSADGRFVVFSSGSTNLVPNDTNDAPDVFVRDRATGQTVRVNISSAGVQADNQGSWSPAISANGRCTAFWSGSANLVAGDTNNIPDLFVHDSVTGETTRVNVTSAGAQSTDFWLSDGTCSISGDGRFVTFASDYNLVSSPNFFRKIYVHDRLTATTSTVSVSSTGEYSNGSSFNPTITADGRYIVFESGGSNLVQPDTNGSTDVFTRDLLTGVTTLESISSVGAIVAGGGNNASISDNGMFVTFHSFASTLVSGDTNSRRDVFVHNRLTGETTRESVSSLGEQSNESTEGQGEPARISADGRFVTFRCHATNLVPGTQLAGHAFLRDRLTGETSIASVSTAGVQANSVCLSPTISSNGRFVVFQSQADNLVPNDSNSNNDIFVRDLGPQAILGDLNGDGVVNGADLGTLLSSWGPCAGCPADLNGNGVVDGADLGTMMSNWT